MIIEDLITEKIKPNGKGEITGQVLQDTLLQVVDSTAPVLDVSSIADKTFITLDINYNPGWGYPFVKESGNEIWSRYNYIDYSSVIDSVENQIAFYDPQIIRYAYETVFYPKKLYHIGLVGELSFFYAIYQAKTTDNKYVYRIINISSLAE